MTEMQERIQDLEECARYILEFEESDFENQFYNEPDFEPEKHIYAIAHLALHGKQSTDLMIREYLLKARPS